jgi:hypothetical protein
MTGQDRINCRRWAMLLNPRYAASFCSLFSILIKEPGFFMVPGSSSTLVPLAHLASFFSFVCVAVSLMYKVKSTFQLVLQAVEALPLVSSSSAFFSGILSDRFFGESYCAPDWPLRRLESGVQRSGRSKVKLFFPNRLRSPPPLPQSTGTRLRSHGSAPSS